MQELARYFRQCTTARIEDAGHLPYEELPDEFNRAALAYLLANTKPPLTTSH
jgi:pimeloyl-ACP methyl ester carboxylesterase